jgi:hypothetical protein
VKAGLTALFAALALGLLVIACGGDDDDAPAATTPAATADTSGDGDGGPTATAGEDDDPTATKEPDDGDGGGDAEGLGCALVDDDTIDDIMGVEMDPGEADGEAGCSWDSTENFGLLSVLLTVRTGTHDEMQDYFNIDIGGDEIDGIGEAARWNDSLDFLEVLQGNFDFDVQVLDFTGEDIDVQAKAEAVALEVLANLPD